MALIKCPECGREISDKAGSCPGCGFPINNVDYNSVGDWQEIPASNAIKIKFNNKRILIEQYGSKIIEDNIEAFDITSSVDGITPILIINHKSMLYSITTNRVTAVNLENILIHIGKKLESSDNKEEPKTPEFDGVYRYVLGSKQEVYCPRCNSSNCSHYKEQRVIPGRTKTKYTANLNPLKPFTLVNKKEKVIKQERVVTEDKFICNSCGKIFN